MKIVRESLIKHHMDKWVLVEVVEEYHYDTEEERVSHSQYMVANGFSDSGKMMKNMGTMMYPEYVYYGKYGKKMVDEYQSERFPESRRILTDKERLLEALYHLSKTVGREEHNAHEAQGIDRAIRVVEESQEELEA